AGLLDVPRSWLSLNCDAPVAADFRAVALTAARRLAAGVPIAYAVGRTTFRHLTLDVDERVLIPRPETEVLVDVVLARCGLRTAVVADIGTGSGAIALSLAFEQSFGRVIATDISMDALAVARKNLDRLAPTLKSPVELRHGSVLAPLAGERLDAIISNPPYISFTEAAELPPGVRDWEPAVALMAAADGLSVTRQLVRTAPDYLHAGGLLAMEVDTRRAGVVAEVLLVDERYREVEVLTDLTGRERFVAARRV
nr:peptide chain release factor N(5)-glutamine methyltransferase [Gemmatimonadaceae bacterium]